MATRQRERAERNAQNADKRPRAIAKNLRVSPSKVRIVLNIIRGKDYLEADAILRNMPNVGAEYAVKVLESAAANAENNLLSAANAPRNSAIKKVEVHQL